MKKPLTKDNLFKPAKSAAGTKADITDKAAKSILEEDAAKRRKKTEALRKQRLALANEKA